ncbi:MAG: ABC transporter permease [Christensenellales bacterium]
MSGLTMATGILSATVAAGTILLLACLGEILSERAGVMNLGVEGMMMVGAVFGFIAVQWTGNLLVGVLAALVGGGLMALIHAFLSITLKTNQVVSGLALTIFGTGLGNFLGNPYVGVVRRASFDNIAIPGLSRIPLLGPVLFDQNLLVYLSILLVPLLWLLIFRTRWGLSLRATGENPAAADTAGVNIFALRYGYTIAGGALAGLAGAYLSLAYNNSWMDTITTGQGWIAVALVIFAMWNPWKAMLGSYLFGFIIIMGFRIQAYGIAMPFYIVNLLPMLPYLFTIIVLIFVTGSFGGRRKEGAPEALSVPYDREAR